MVKRAWFPQRVRPSGIHSADGRRLWIEWWTMALVATLLLTTLVVTSATTRLDNAIYDLTLKLERRAPRSDIVIVGMEPLMTPQEPQWPWPRRLDAELLTAIAKEKPKAVVLSLLFLFRTNPLDDGALRDALKLTPTFIPIPQKPYMTPQGSIDRPISEFLSVAAGSGFVDQKGDDDGIVRRTSLFKRSRGQSTLRLVAKLAITAPSEAVSRGIQIPRGRVLIPYTRTMHGFNIVDARTVLDGKAKPGQFRDKYVLIGSTAADIQDKNPTPTSSAMPDVVTDANVLDGLLNGRMIVGATPFTTLTISIVFLWTLLVALLRLGPRENLRFAAAMFVLPLGATTFALTILDLWVPPAAFLLTVSIVTPYWGWRRLHAASDYFAQELRGLEPQIRTQSSGELRPGGPEGDVVLQQMTLLQEAKRRISDLRRFVSDILANFPDPIFVVDLNGDILTVNESATHLGSRLGAPAVAGASVDTILSRIRPISADKPSIWPSIRTLTATATTPAAAGGFTGRGPDGRAFELRLTPTLNAEDEPTGSIVHLADVTVLISAVDAREVAMRQREEALQLLSHDMRSPQASILAVLQHPDFRRAPKRLIQLVEMQARRTLDLADAFVRLAQAESAHYILEAIDFSYIAEEAVDALWSLAQQGGVILKLERLEGEFIVFADRGALMRAMVNLLDNAVKFSSRGAFVVCKVRGSTLNGRPAVACDVVDSAGGMPPARAEKIFDRFATSGEASNGTTGVGLGLPLVQAVAARHGGNIVCRTIFGQGSVFTLTVPLHDDAEGSMALQASA